MEQKDFEAWQGLAAYGNRLEAVTQQLASQFPEFPNWLAWQETIFTSQGAYRSTRPDLSDLRLYIAERWLQLAKDGHLKVTMDPSRGMIVQEALDDASQKVTRKDIEKMLFMLLNKLPIGQLLQIYEIQTAFYRLTGQSLKDHELNFSAVVDDLSEKRYIRWDNQGGRKMPRFARALDFDIWSNEMTSKPIEHGPITNTFNFNGTVGAVQTGSQSVANVQQTIGASQFSDLKSALQLALEEFSKADLHESDRTDAQELIQSVLDEIDKPKPSKLSLKALFGTVATTVQTLGSTSDAYKAVTTAIAAVSSLF